MSSTLPPNPLQDSSAPVNTSIELAESDISRIIEMAWEDRTAFDTIEAQFGVNESAVIMLMRKHMKRSSFEMWRARVSGRKTKHAARRSDEVLRFKSRDQKGN